MKKFLSLFLTIGLLLGLTSCGGEAPESFTVSFETEYGTAPKSFDVEYGTILRADQLNALTCEGYTFKGWFNGETEAKAGEYKVTKDVTLTAKWEFKFLGIYDCFTLPNSIQVRITLSEDKTCALDLLFQPPFPMANITFKGTYTVEDALVKIDLDKEKLSLTSGITWEDFNTFDWKGAIGVTSNQVEEYLTKAKTGCVKIGKDKLIFTDQGYDFDFVPGKDFDERLVGAWEAKSGEISSRVLFNEDKTCVLGAKMTNNVNYAKGKYLTLQNYIKVILVEDSQDNISYTPASKVLTEIMNYSFANDELIWGDRFNKMSTTDITFE